MRMFREDLLLQITSVTFVVLLLMAALLTSVLDNRLKNILPLVEQYGREIQAGPIEPSELYSVPSISKEMRNIRGTAYLLIAGSVVVLYLALGGLAWNGARRIGNLKSAVDDAEGALEPTQARLDEIQAQLAATKAELEEAQGNGDSSLDDEAIELIVAERTAVLAASEELYRDLYENSPDMMAIVQIGSGEITNCNQTLADVFGRPREDIIGTLVYDLYANVSKGIARQNLNSFGQTGVLEGQERTLVKADGSEITVLERGSPIYDENGNIGASHSSWRDVTDYTKGVFELARS